MTKFIPFSCFMALVLLFATTAEAQNKSFNKASSKITLRFSISHNLIKGKDALRDGEINKAITLLSKATQENLRTSDFYSASNDLCVAYYLNDEFKKAIDRCNQAIRNTSNKWFAYNNRGNVYLSSGRYTLAIKDYERGLEINPKSRALITNMEIAQRRLAKNDKSGQDDNNNDNLRPVLEGETPSATTKVLR